MTRAEWDALMREDPRKCDVLFGEKVMGATWETEPKWPGGSAEVLHAPIGMRGHGFWATIENGKPLMVWAGCPHFTTSWGDMRGVANMLHKLGYGVGMYGGSYDPTGEYGWEVELRPGGEDPEHFAGPARALPEAVCVAALTALGYMDPQ